MPTKPIIRIIEVDRELNQSENFERDIVTSFTKKSDLVVTFYPQSKGVSKESARIEVILLNRDPLFREKFQFLFTGLCSNESEKKVYMEIQIRNLEKEGFYEALTIDFAPEIRMFSIEKPS